MLQHRRLLYDLFTKSYRVKRAAVQARLAQEFGDISKAEVDRLFQVRWVLLLWNSVVQKLSFLVCLLTCHMSLQECCSSYAGMWYLKGTIQSWRWQPAPCGHRRKPIPLLPGVQWEGSQTNVSQSQLPQLWGQRRQMMKLFCFQLFLTLPWALRSGAKSWSVCGTNIEKWRYTQVIAKGFVFYLNVWLFSKHSHFTPDL